VYSTWALRTLDHRLAKFPFVTAKAIGPAEHTTNQLEHAMSNNSQVIENVTPATPVKRKPGRPAKFAPWFPAVAKTMANGTSLRNALLWNRIQVEEYGKRPQSELEAIRKNFERLLR
jgi:hypothetical protein